MRALLTGMLALLGACSGGGGSTPAAQPAALDTIRIGWQQTWATQGQLAVTLMKTDILEKHGFKGDFKGFSYGGPLNEGALAGEVDVSGAPFGHELHHHAALGHVLVDSTLAPGVLEAAPQEG